jgi:hypothetical protein
VDEQDLDPLILLVLQKTRQRALLVLGEYSRPVVTAVPALKQSVPQPVQRQ